MKILEAVDLSTVMWHQITSWPCNNKMAPYSYSYLFIYTFVNLSRATNKFPAPLKCWDTVPYNAELLENLLGNYEIWMNCFMNIVPLLCQKHRHQKIMNQYMRTVIISVLHESDKEEFYHSNGQYFLNAKNLLAYEKKLEDLTISMVK